jgi:hypothetical protein
MTKKQTYKVDSAGHVVLGLPISGISLSIRPAKGKDVRELQQALDNSGGLTDYEAGVFILGRCIVSIDGQAQEEPVGVSWFDDLDMRDVNALQAVMEFFQA